MHRLLLALPLVAACQAGIEAGGRTTDPDAALQVTTQVLGTSELPVTTVAPATLIADATVALRTEVGGRVSDVLFRDGDTVEAGAVLVRLNDARARADLDAAQASLDLATTRFDRTSRLFALERVSQAEVDDARAQRLLAEAELARARDALRQTVVRAPRRGRLGPRAVEPGAVVDPGTLLTTLVATTPLRATLSVPEQLAGTLAVGTPATLTSEAAPGKRFPATVDYVAPSVDPDTRLLSVRLVLGDDVGPLLPGMSARAEVEVRPPGPALLVPSEAVTTESTGPMVWVVEDGRAHVRPVHLGLRRAEDVVVTEGLAPGEEIVVRGIVRLREGAPVTTRSASARAEP